VQLFPALKADGHVRLLTGNYANFKPSQQSVKCVIDIFDIVYNFNSQAKSLSRVVLPFFSDYYFPATTILQRLPFSGDYYSPDSRRKRFLGERLYQRLLFFSFST
jgi:hypothetical protein